MMNTKTWLIDSDPIAVVVESDLGSTMSGVSPGSIPGMIFLFRFLFLGLKFFIQTAAS
jgi:hypothetical protein